MQRQSEKANLNNIEQLNHNEQIVLQSLSVFAPITSNLFKLEHHLYSNPELLPRPIFKEFRKLRDDFETLFSLISSFTSDNPLFNGRKDEYLQDQIQAMEMEINRQQPSKAKPVQESRSRISVQPKRIDEEGERRAELLSKEIESLKNQLRRNDAEYEIQIKKYNLKYDEMLEEIEYYRREAEKMDEYIDTIDKLQVEIRVLNETKQRDDQLIQNMAYKLRNLEKERYGRTAFLSPNRSFVSPLSPSASRVHTHYSPRTLHSQYS